MVGLLLCEVSEDCLRYEARADRRDMKPHSRPIPSVRRMEWLVALAPALLAGVVYILSMPPAITMDYAGQYVAASFSFGVPIPPGYPFWTLCGFMWSHYIFPFGNPAWRFGMMSVTAGAALVGVMSLTMMRSTRWLLEGLPWSKAIDPKQVQWIAASVSTSTALMFGFDRTVWQCACLPEPPALYTLLYFLAAASFLQWIREPVRRRHLYATVVFLSLTVATADMNALPVTAVMVMPFFVGVLAVGIETARATSVKS